MQTRTASYPLPHIGRGLLVRLIAAACATLVWTGASTASSSATVTASPTTSPVVPATYRIVPLAPNGAVAGINAKGQVAYTAYEGDITRARFYDGTMVRDLGTFGGPSAVVYALNEHGQVAGTASSGAGQPYHAFRWSRQTGLVDLNGPGVGNSIATDINNKGQVVGLARFPGTPESAFRWSPASGMVNLGTLGPVSTSAAFAINDAGTATGYSEEAGGPRLIQAIKWPPGGGLVTLNDFPSIASVGNDINNAGQIVGSAALDAGLSDQAFIWTRQGGLQGMGTAPSYHSYAERINEKGLVIGELYTTPGDRNGFIWSRENGLLVVGTPLLDRSDVTGLNNRGQVVGYLNEQAFIWTRASGFVDLNSLVPDAPPGLGPFFPAAISDNGTIVAGSAAGLFLLVPNGAYHQPPVAGPVKLTGTARVNALLSFTAAFKDVDVRDTHKAVWSWGDGSTSAGTVSERNGNGSVSGQHAYRAAGIYTVRLTITDSGGKRSTVERKVVVCGCGTAAAVSGEGSFVAPALAKGSGARRVSVGSFAFLSEGGARKAIVQVNVAGMALRSTRVDAVTTGAGRVQYSGWGTVNGSGNYRFTLSAISGAKSDGKDRIHVRIAHTAPGMQAEVVDYDNAAVTGKPGAAQSKAASLAGSVVLEGRVELGVAPGGQ